MNKEKWINDSLESINGIKRAKPGSFLFPKILHSLKNDVYENIYISKKKVVIGFLTIILLAALNAGTILLKKNTVSSGYETNSIVKEYFPSQTNYLNNYLSN